ncbi:MAG: branched-chain amino acid ABC transporter permease [Deltaproteobacteria bacterium]|nr:branched-chain amino acid ABC transporter permease [Deltaproteobacteria bacterium]
MGGIYALAAFGLSIVFGVLNVLNIAHGEFMMLGALGAYLIYVATGLNPFFIILIIIPVFALFSWGFQRILIRPIKGKTETEILIASILVTLGASLLIEDVTFFFWPKSFTSIPFSLSTLHLGEVMIPTLRLYGLVIIVFLTVVVSLFLRKSHTGRAIRALAQNMEGAKVVGIPTEKVATMTFILGTSLAAVAGVFYVTLYSMTPYMGLPLTVKYMVIVIMGGLGGLAGPLAAGLILGITETFVGYYLGSVWAPSVAYIAFILVLLIRPQGLFGLKE